MQYHLSDEDSNDSSGSEIGPTTWLKQRITELKQELQNRDNKIKFLSCRLDENNSLEMREDDLNNHDGEDENDPLQQNVENADQGGSKENQEELRHEPTVNVINGNENEPSPDGKENSINNAVAQNQVILEGPAPEDNQTPPSDQDILLNAPVSSY